MKTCNKCNETKELTEFHKNKNTQDGYRYNCKSCRRKKNKGRNSTNSLKPNGMKTCTMCKKDKGFAEFSYKDTSSKDPRNLRPSCKSCKNNQSKIHYISNKETVRKQQLVYERNKRATDPMYRMIKHMRNNMYQILNGTAKCASQLELLGCSREHYRHHMEAQFTEGMHWGNYGEWHQDHIQPCASFDQEDPEQQKICWHYTNFQPLWAKDNCSKNDQIVPQHQVNLL